MLDDYDEDEGLFAVDNEDNDDGIENEAVMSSDDHNGYNVDASY